MNSKEEIKIVQCRLMRLLEEYVEHTKDCILSYWEAGEPIPDGGYRVKYKGIWYMSRPVNETPDCTCGLAEIWESYRRDVLGEIN